MLPLTEERRLTQSMQSPTGSAPVPVRPFITEVLQVDRRTRDDRSRFLDNRKAQCLTEANQRFFYVTVDRDTMPAKLIPLVEQLADVARDFANQLGAASEFAIECPDSFGLMQDQLLACYIGAEGRRHVSGRK